jgi:hypothetical protein
LNTHYLPSRRYPGTWYLTWLDDGNKIVLQDGTNNKHGAVPPLVRYCARRVLVQAFMLKLCTAKVLHKVSGLE